MLTTRALTCCLIAFLFSGLVFAQSEEGSPGHFHNGGLKFDYPASWLITDNSTETIQHLTLTSRGSSVQVEVVVKREPTFRNELPSAMLEFSEPVLQRVAKLLGKRKESLQQIPINSRVSSTDVEGIRLQVAEDADRVADIIYHRSKLRLAALIFIRSRNDEAAQSAWEMVRHSFTTDPIVIGTMVTDAPDADLTNKRLIEGGVLNGRALQLPNPAYPAIARAAHVSGSVKVQVLIDEFGNVVSAHAIEGHPLLQAVSVQAARQAMFSPTLLDNEPVRVTGVIVYNFVAK